MRTNEIKLNLGCGADYKKGFVNIDYDGNVKADQYLDLNKIPYNIMDNSVDYILCNQVLEHLRISLFDFFNECNRIMKRDAILEMNFPNAFFWRNRIAFLMGRFRGSYWSPFHTKLIHPTNVKFIALMVGFGIDIEKTGLSFLPISLSEYNLHYKFKKR